MAYIPPTPGRVVLFVPRKDDNIAKLPGQPLAAVICGVDPAYAGEKVSLAVFSAKGSVHGYENITLVQEGGVVPLSGDYCHWMLFQLGQAAKTEAAISELAAATLAP